MSIMFLVLVLEYPMVNATRPRLYKSVCRYSRILPGTIKTFRAEGSLELESRLQAFFGVTRPSPEIQDHLR